MGYALLKAKSSKILKQDGFAAEDETAESVCSLYVYLNNSGAYPCRTISDQISTNHVLIVAQSQTERLS